MAGVGASGEGCRRGGRGCKGRGPGAARHLHLALRHLPLSQQLAGNLRRRVLGAVDVPRRARADKVVQHDAVPPDELEAAPLNLVDGARRAGEWRRGRCHALPRRRVARRLARGEARPVAQILARRRRPSLVDARKAAAKGTNERSAMITTAGARRETKLRLHTSLSVTQVQLMMAAAMLLHQAPHTIS